VIPHEKRIADKLFTRYFVKPIDTFITMSTKVMNDLKTVTNKPAQQVVHPLYDNFGEALSKKEARNYLGLEENGKLILFFGVIRKYKGLDLLLEAMSLLGDDVQLLIAGEFYDDRKIYDD
jgi:glycosyltransferase involved in cell wall biosynthesis